ncbi:hypothetical protein [Streptomyces sp. NPDC059651]
MDAIDLVKRYLDQPLAKEEGVLRRVGEDSAGRVSARGVASV